MSRLFYLPLEGYKERYTQQWSAPSTGWLERNWKRAGINYKRIEGDIDKNRTIKVGSVVDAIGRSTYCFSQISRLLYMAEQGDIKDTDIIYFDDFWHPGLEALPYAFHLLGIKPKIYGFLHAQTVDEYDFTHPMRHWMRSIEKGFGSFLTGIFVCCPFLQRLVVEGGIAPVHQVHVTGHPFSSEEVKERMPVLPPMRNNRVVWSSRWDKEKNPDFFLKVVLNILSREKKEHGRYITKFIICTGAPILKSNDPQLLVILNSCMKMFPDNIIVRPNLSKEEYYTELTNARVQFNCASQDFVAITLLEATVAGCYPVYPEFRSFPETFHYQPQYMYKHLNEESATTKLWNVLCMPDHAWSKEAIDSRNWIYKRFDYSWIRMLNWMKISVEEPISMAHHKMYPEIAYMSSYHTE